MDDDTRKKCIKCKKDKTHVEFISDTGEFKMCNLCRARKRTDKKRESDRQHKIECRKDPLFRERESMYQKQYFHGSIDRRLYMLKHGACTRGYDWYISDEYAKELMTSPCHYCGLCERVNGMDRVDNSLGYWSSNVVPCCKLCNYFKKNYTVEEFLGHAKRITGYQQLFTK